MRAIVQLRKLLAVALLSGTIACGSDGGDTPATPFKDRLTTGSWSRTIGHPPLQDTYTYEFRDDGTYRQVLFTDVLPPPSDEGTWSINRDAEGRTHLLLIPNNSGSDCYWLACDSIAFFRNGTLYVTGEPYVNEQPLEHTPPLDELLP